VRRRWILAGLLAISCGDDGGNTADDDSSGSSGGTSASTSGTTSASTSGTTTATGTDAGDTEAPELVDVRVSINGGSLVDLNGADVSRVFPEPASAEFTIRARDDVSEDENLIIEVFDAATGDPVTTDAAMFINGLWRVTVTVEADHTYKARATDEAANSTDSQFGLVAPSFAEAVVREWDAFYYDSESVSERYNLTLVDDGTWTETALMGSRDRSGTWSVEGTQFTLVETTNTDGDTNPDTEDIAYVGEFFVSDDYLDLRPYRGNDGQDSEVEGSWTRTWTEQEPGGGGLQDARTVEETLELNMNGDYSWTQTTTPTGGSAVVTTESGTWRIELNGEYFANYGDFLVLTTDDIDGVPQDPAIETWALHRARGDRLLVTPYVPFEG
jgi:hypothetical protein